jgi:perosamine synthetase
MPAERWVSHSASNVEPGDFQYIDGIMQRNFVGDGPLCAELRQLLKSRYSCCEAILTDSGAAALHLALLGLGRRYPHRKRVLLSAYVCPQVVTAVLTAGLEPVLVDTRRDSLNMDMDAAARLVASDTLAIICSHVGGMPDDCALASSFGIPVISDCAQALGTEVRGQDLACVGICAVLSFGSTKMVTAGSGGALLCRDGELAAVLTQLANPELTAHEYRLNGFQVTYGQHMGDITAGLACSQLHRLAGMIERRRMIASQYSQALSGQKDLEEVAEAPEVRCNRFRFYFLALDARSWIDALRKRGVDARRSIAHAIPEYQGNLRQYPGLMSTFSRMVSLPIFPTMAREQFELVGNALAEGPGE